MQELTKIIDKDFYISSERVKHENKMLDEVINKSLVWEERYTPSVKTLNANGWRSVFSARTTPILEVGKYLVMINMGFKGISSGLGTVRGLVDGSEYRNARMSFPLGSGSILTDVTVTFLLTITNRKTYTISCDIYPTVSCENRNYPVQIILLRVG